MLRFVVTGFVIGAFAGIAAACVVIRSGRH